MARIELAALTQWITAAAVQHRDDLPAFVMDRLGISRRRTTLLLRKLAATQWLTSTGTPRKPCHSPGPLRQVVKRYPLQGLQEDLPWRRDFAPFFALPASVQRLAQHAFTELLNNAVDHSGGTSVTVSLRQTALHLQLLVSDNGCGVFKRIEDSFGIDDPQWAMFELSKGKLTSQPDRHCGHGLYFSARLADVFHLHANRAAFQYRGFGNQPWRTTRPAPHVGTSVYLAIALDTPRTLDAVLRAQGSDTAAYSFQRTQVPLHLLVGGDTLASRADAKRVVSRLQTFGSAELDFTGIEHIGHGFADELFRVFRREHPGVELVPLAMNAQVSSMLASIAP